MLFRNTTLCTAVLLSAISLSAETSNPQIETSLGVVQGIVEGDVQIYRGIPYAEPPLGPLRWSTTRPKNAWKGTLDASNYGPICPQPGGNQNPAGHNEDCLTLNVWSPVDRQELLPVMVWIHGGGHVLGSGQIDGTAFARDGIVLVSINYRLGTLGVFALPEVLEAAGADPVLGNFHLMDQIEALKWVQREITAFGGDPNQVTIFGVSAGGSNVNLLMASPLSENLFHGAIAQSGGNGLESLRSLADQAAMDVKLLDAMGVENLEELRTVPWRDILQSGPDTHGAPGPLIDGVAVPESPTDAFTAGRQHNVPYIAGANSFEGSLRRALPIPFFDELLAQNHEEISAVYGLDADDPILSLEFYGDMLFVAPTRYLVSQMSQVEASGWHYYFDMVLSQLADKVPGAGHGTEVSYVFETLAPVNIPEGISAFTGIPVGFYEPSVVDLAGAAAVHRYWVEFAKTGSPNGKGLVDWKPYAGDAPQTLILSNNAIGMHSDFQKGKLDWIETAMREE